MMDDGWWIMDDEPRLVGIDDFTTDIIVDISKEYEIESFPIVNFELRESINEEGMTDEDREVYDKWRTMDDG